MTAGVLQLSSLAQNDLSQVTISGQSMPVWSEVVA